MSRRVRSRVAWVLVVFMAASGCQPTQPFFFMEDGDLSHYVDVATQVEYADVDEPPLGEVAGAHAPLTIDNFDGDLTDFQSLS